jgi:hypothetical protein
MKYFIIFGLTFSFVCSCLRVSYFGPAVPNISGVENNFFFNQQDHLDIAFHFAKEKYPIENGFGIVLKNDYKSFHGVRHVYLKQTFEGVEINNADMAIHMKNGQIIFFSSSFFNGTVPNGK